MIICYPKEKKNLYIHLIIIYIHHCICVCLNSSLISEQWNEIRKKNLIDVTNRCRHTHTHNRSWTEFFFFGCLQLFCGEKKELCCTIQFSNKKRQQQQQHHHMMMMMFIQYPDVDRKRWTEKKLTRVSLCVYIYLNFCRDLLWWLVGNHYFFSKKKFYEISIFFSQKFCLMNFWNKINWLIFC